MIAPIDGARPFQFGSLVVTDESPRELLAALTIAFAVGPISGGPRRHADESRQMVHTAERRFAYAHVRWAVVTYVRRLSAEGYPPEHVLNALQTAVRRARPDGPCAARDICALDAWVAECGSAERLREDEASPRRGARTGEQSAPGTSALAAGVPAEGRPLTLGARVPIAADGIRGRKTTYARAIQRAG